MAALPFEVVCTKLDARPFSTRSSSRFVRTRLDVKFVSTRSSADFVPPKMEHRSRRPLGHRREFALTIRRVRVVRPNSARRFPMMDVEEVAPVGRDRQPWVAPRSSLHPDTSSPYHRSADRQVGSPGDFRCQEPTAPFGDAEKGPSQSVDPRAARRHGQGGRGTIDTSRHLARALATAAQLVPNAGWAKAQRRRRPGLVDRAVNR